MVDAEFNRLSLVYEIDWACPPDAFYQDIRRDFPLVQSLSNWLCDVTACNTNDLDNVTREWYIVHKTPGHIFLFLSLYSDDLEYRIQYPFTPPENWISKPLVNARWVETRVGTYDELTKKRQEIETPPIFSRTGVGSHIGTL